MSGIAGIVHLDGRPVAHGDLSDMTAAMAHRGPDGVDHWVEGNIGLGHCMLRTTTQSLREAQPHRDESGELCLTLDGRVDNRAELRAALGGARRHLRDDTDAELVLQAYRCWGTGCISRIVGDFAFALWDGSRRQLVCARDFFGKRPFYYHFNGSSLRFGSEPQAVLADRSVPREPNKAMIGEYLAVTLRSTTETLFRHLLRLAPAHFMVVSAGGLRVTRYWDWDPGRQVRYSDDQQYVSHFLEVCASALEARLPSPWPVVVELSGGVDSSSLVGLVEHLRRAGRYGASLEAYSMVFPGRACDESAYIRDVARHCDVVCHEVRPRPVGAGPYEAQVRRYLDLPDYPSTMMHRPLCLAAKENGCRVLLTGKGPDEWLTGSRYSYADSLRRLRLRRVLAEVRADAGASGWRASVRAALYYGVRPQLPPEVRHRVRGAMGRTTCPGFLRASFCRDVDLVDRLRARGPRGPRFADWDVASHLGDGWQAHAHEVGERAAASMGQEFRDPFDDRRVVELALAFPDDQRRRGQATKYVLRQAMAGLIPESVRTRADKANYSHVFCEELRLQGGPKLFQGMVMEDLGWVDGSRVRAMHRQFDQRYRDGDTAYHKHLWPLWLIISVDRWLRATL